MGPNKGILQGWLIIYLLSAGTVATAGMGLYGLSWLVSSARAKSFYPACLKKDGDWLHGGQPEGMHRQGCARAVGHEPRAQESPAGDVMDRFREALERIALLDEADGHELAVRHAFEAVAIAASTLGKHPAEIHADRERRKTHQVT